MSTPLEPCVHGDLVVDFAQHRENWGGQPLPLVVLEYLLLEELATSAGQVLTYGAASGAGLGQEGRGDLRPVRAMVAKLRRRLGTDADHSTSFGRSRSVHTPRVDGSIEADVMVSRIAVGDIEGDYPERPTAGLNRS